MCGICFVSFLSATKECAIAEVEPMVSNQQENLINMILANSLLQHRGPDVTSRHKLQLAQGLPGFMQGCVLHLRGQLTPQPVKDCEGNALLWNGEIFDGIEVKDHENDSEVLFHKLVSGTTEADILATIKSVHGPWAFVFWQANTQKLWFGRDMFGRRSLLWHLPQSSSEYLILSSVAVSDLNFTEIPAVGIFCLDFSDIDLVRGQFPPLKLFPWKGCRWPGTSLMVLDSPETDLQARLYPHFPPSLAPVHVDRQEILDTWIPACSRSQPGTCLSQPDGDSVNSINDLEKMLIEIVRTRNELNSLADEVLQALMSSVDKRVNNLQRESSSLSIKAARGCRQLVTRVGNECSQSSVSQCRKDKTSCSQPVGETGNECCSCGNQSSVGQCMAHRTSCSQPVGETGNECCSCGNQSSVGHCTAHRTSCSQPVGETGNECCSCGNQSSVGHCTAYRTSCSQPVGETGNECCSCGNQSSVGHCMAHRTFSTQPGDGDCCRSTTAHVAILFSGGLDSTILAALADRCVPEDEPIDLLNVAFEQPPRQGSAQHTNQQSRKKKKASFPNTINNPSRSPGIGQTTHDTADNHVTSVWQSGASHVSTGAVCAHMPPHIHSPTSSPAAQDDIFIHCGAHTPDVDSYNVPDRQTGRTALKELNPKRRWNFIEINVSQAELKAQRQDHIRQLIYPLQTVLDDSIGCAVWFAARGAGVVRDGGTSNKCVSKARVLLCGMAADELFGGYSRHRVTFQTKGWQGLENELQEEMWRISARNLGRDDRIISDHGKECRFPFLDESFIQFMSSVPVCQRADLRLPRGVGDKLLLRLCALKLGLTMTAVQPKRAIQFGSKIAKLDQRKEKGSDLCDRLV